MIDQSDIDDAYKEGFHDLPSPAQLAKMSIIQIADRMFNEPNHDSAKYIVLSHELSMKMVRAQNAATITSAKIGIIGVLIGTFLGASLTYLFLK